MPTTRREAFAGLGQRTDLLAGVAGLSVTTFAVLNKAEQELAGWEAALGPVLSVLERLGSLSPRGQGHAVAEVRRGDGDLQEPVVLGHALAAGRGAGLQVAAAGAHGEVGDEGVLGFAGAVGDELPVPCLPADSHRLQGLGDGADLVDLRSEERRVG